MKTVFTLNRIFTKLKCFYIFSQKSWFFWPNHYKIEIVITTLTELIELTNFGHMSTSAT